VTLRPHRHRPCHAASVIAALVWACAAWPTAAHAQTPAAATAPVAVNAGGPPWVSLTPAQQSALAPLKKEWPAIDAARKQKWLEIAARLPSMPAEERQRIQERMIEWARMTPDERGRARLQFQEARQISPQERQARWDAYLALPAEERRALATSATTVPRANLATVRAPAAEPSATAATASVQKNNMVTAPSTATVAKTVAPTVVQAKPGASTTLISKTADPPPHAQVGQPKIAAGRDQVDRSTLLPQPMPKPVPQPAPRNSTAAASASE
jgi:hypothetical protein